MNALCKIMQRTLQHTKEAQPLNSMPRPARNIGYSNLSADMIHLLRNIRPLDTVIQRPATTQVTKTRPILLAIRPVSMSIAPAAGVIFNV